MQFKNILFLAAVSVVFVLTNFLLAVVPGGLITYTSMVLIPGASIVLGVFAYVIMGSDVRIVRKAYQANITAVLVVISFATMVMFVSFFFGGGRNIMTPNVMAVLRNVWAIGVPLVFGEYVRIKIIKTTPEKHLVLVLAIVTLVFAFTNVGGLRALFMASDPNYLRFFFESVMAAVTVSALLSFMSMRGTFLSVVVVSFVLNLGATFSPVLPMVSNEVWALLVSVLAFCAGILFYYLTDDKNAAQRKRLNRAAKYTKGNPAATFLTLTFTALVVAFFLNVFTYYPVVILTGSMTGSHDRGSLVVMRRIPPEHVQHVVKVGDVLHYHVGAVEFVHRVIDFVYIDGTRAFVTKGDANEFPDPRPLLMEDVIGTPVLNIPFLGFPNLIFRTMTGGIF